MPNEQLLRLSAKPFSKSGSDYSPSLAQKSLTLSDSLLNRGLSNQVRVRLRPLNKFAGLQVTIDRNVTEKGPPQIVITGSYTKNTICRPVTSVELIT